MKVAVTGATGVIGVSAVRALVAAEHEVVALARTLEKAALLEQLGATPVRGDVFDHDALVGLFAGCDAVCNFATRIRFGYAATLPGAWRENDQLRTEGVARVLTAARAAGVRRVVQESVSFIYADNGEDWITEQSPVAINRATEPLSIAESQVQSFTCESRQGVVLRFGIIVGDDPMTRWYVQSAERGLPIGIGAPTSWGHVIHPDDLGPAVVCALTAPSGVYNVGAEPVRRGEVVQAIAKVAGQDEGKFMGPLLRRMAGGRVEPLTRSLRVSSEHFTATSGWTPTHPTFDASWLDGLLADNEATR